VYSFTPLIGNEQGWPEPHPVVLQGFNQMPYCAYYCEAYLLRGAKIIRIINLRALRFCEVLQKFGKFAKFAIFRGVTGLPSFRWVPLELLTLLILLEYGYLLYASTPCSRSLHLRQQQLCLRTSLLEKLEYP
jgi:hypothetical protein